MACAAKHRKRHRLRFFNSGDGERLRRSAGHQERKRAEAKYCALCGNNSRQAELRSGESQTPMFRGHHSVFFCNLCHVHLCKNVYDNYRLSCFDKWHTAKTLQIPVMKQPRSKAVVPQPIRSVSTPGQDLALHGLNMQTRRVNADRSPRDPSLARNTLAGALSSDDRNAVVPCAVIAPLEKTVPTERGSSHSVHRDTIPVTSRRYHRHSLAAPSAAWSDAQGRPPRPSTRAKRSQDNDKRTTSASSKRRRAHATA